MESNKKWYNRDLQISSARFKDEQKLAFYETLSTLLLSGLELIHALEVAAEEQKKEVHSKMIEKFIDQIVQGKTLYNCLEENKQFSSYESYSIQIGEETGRLAYVLEQLAFYFDKRVKQRRQIIGALTYPIVVFSFSVLAVLFMVTYVVPMFEGVFKRFGGELPAVTQFIITVSNTVQNNIFGIILSLLGLIMVVRWLLNQQKIKRQVQYTLMRIPILGNLVRDSYMMRWCSAMHLMSSANISLTRSLAVTARMLRFHPLMDSLDAAILEIEKGALLHQVFKQFSFFTKRSVSLIAIGEEVNQLAKMFLTLSANLEKEVEHKTKQITTIIEPIIILILGGIVAFILVAMYLPMFKLGDGIS